MVPKEITYKRILISPLNWGMGHVARCIPLIDGLIKNENKVIVACSSDQKLIFQQYFPAIEFIDHAGYPFSFGIKGRFALDLMNQFIPLKKRLKKERLEVEEYIQKYSIDLVISDHRYGFRSDHVHSIILTHQLNLPVRWYESWVQKIHHNYLRSFHEIWVPDTVNSDCSGEMSANVAGLKVNYIGLLSRFSLYDKFMEKDLDAVVVVSGPVVYAKQFLEEEIKNSLVKGENKLFILSQELVPFIPSNAIQHHVSNNWKECDLLIMRAKKIISRSGYSTLMDLIELKTPFVISPTPGQREQESLFNLWYKKSLHNAGTFIENKE